MRAYLSDDALFTRIVEACNRAADGSEAVSGVTAEPDDVGAGRPARAPSDAMAADERVARRLVENQHFADERTPLLLQTPAAVRFLLCEPLLEALDLRHYIGLDGANQ